MQVFFALLMEHPSDLGLSTVEIADEDGKQDCNTVVGSFLGSGAHSVVFEVPDSEYGPCVVKVSSDLDKDQRHYQAEVDMLQALEAIPGLCDRELVPTLLEELLTTDGRTALLMWPRGVKVLHSMRNTTAASAPATHALNGADFIQLLDVVQQLREANIAHRDIKPSNVLYHGGHVVLIDFDIALRLDDATLADITLWRGELCQWGTTLLVFITCMTQNALRIAGTRAYFDPKYDQAVGSLPDAVAGRALYFRQCDLRSLVRTIYVLRTKMGHMPVILCHFLYTFSASTLPCRSINNLCVARATAAGEGRTSARWKQEPVPRQ